MPAGAEGNERGNQAAQAPGAAPAIISDAKAFISYASADKVAADSIVAALESAGITCWIAPRDVTPGTFYADAIVEALNAANLLIVVLSAHSVGSHHVLREVERASSKKRPLVAFRLDATPLPPALEYFLSASHWLDATTGAISAALAELVDATRKILALPPPSAAQAPPHKASRAVNHGVRALTRVSGSELLLIGLLLGIGGSLLWLIRPITQRAEPTRATQSKPAKIYPSATEPTFAPPAHSIAVLPFVNMSGDMKQEYFSDGISEELLNSLARLNDLEVVARTSSFSFKGQNVDVATIAHKLNVGTIVEGSVRRAGNTVRITVQLINATSGFHIWSQTYDRNLTDILKVQSEVAISVAKQLETKLLGDEAAKIALGGTSNPEAYDAYLRGVELLSTGDVKEADLRAALAALDRAIVLDPRYAQAHARRAGVLGNISIFVNLKPGELAAVRAQALQAAERAVALAPELGDAHLALAQVRAYDLLDFGAAAPEFERALALSPGSARVQGGFAGFAGQVGHFEGAVDGARRAVALDPQNIDSLISLGLVLNWARHYDEALTVFRGAKALRPGSAYVSFNMASTLLASGQFEEARQLCESSSIPPTRGRLRCLALAYHALGLPQKAERALEQYKTFQKDEPSFGLAQLYAQWGNNALSLAELAKAWEHRDSTFQLLRVDWELDPIRHEPQFHAIERLMNFPP